MTVVQLRPGTQSPIPFDANAPKPEGDWEVRVWTPNKAGYHSDGMATMIPHAEDGKGGASLGFEAGAGVVNVGANPSTGEGGIPVDMSRVSAAESAQAYQAARSVGGTRAERIENAFRMLGVPVDNSARDVAAEATDNPLVSPDAYITPAADLDGRQLNQGASMAAYPPPPRVGQPPAPAAQPVPMPGQTQQVPPVATAPMPQVSPVPYTANGQADQTVQLMAMMAQQSNQTNEMMRHMLATLQNLAQPPLPNPAPVQPEPLERAPTRDEYDLMQEEESRAQKEEQEFQEKQKVDPERAFTKKQVYEVVGKSFDTLGIPRLGPDATKPAYLVNFDMPMGQLSSRYHWVGVHGKGLFLIYDRRYEHGTEYIPPNLGVDESGRAKTMVLTCPDQNKSFTVKNPGFVHPFGKLLIINLIIVDAADSGQLPIDDEEEEIPQLSSGESTDLDVTQPGMTLEAMLQGGLG